MSGRDRSLSLYLYQLLSRHGHRQAQIGNHMLGVEGSSCADRHEMGPVNDARHDAVWDML